MLKRLIEWSPVKFASCLATRLCSELSIPKYTDVTEDEVGIMLAKSGTLYNRVLLDSLPRYQTNRSNIKREGKLYSHETQMDILEAQARQKERQVEADGKEPDFLTSIAPQLTSNQLEIIKAEMEKEEETRKRVSKVSFYPSWLSGFKGESVITSILFLALQRGESSNGSSHHPKRYPSKYK